MEIREIAGSIGIVIVGFLWFKLYAQKRIEREGVAKGLARRETGRQFVRDTEEQLERTDQFEVLIPIRQDVTREQKTP